MPVIARVGPYRFFFYSNESDEPPHVHVMLAKFWLLQVALESSRGFAAHELRDLERIIVERRLEFLKRWDEFFST